MKRLLQVILAILLFAVGAVAATAFLTGQGLDRAEKWVSIVGVLVSVAMAAAGLLLTWWSWRAQTMGGTGPGNGRSPGAAQPAGTVGTAAGCGTAHPASAVNAGGIGAVAIGEDSRGEIVAEVSGVSPPLVQPPSPGSGVHASGTGSVAVGGSSNQPIRTRVTGPDSGGAG